MINSAYSDVVEDDQQDARASEREAIQRSIQQMRDSDNSHADRQARMRAITYTIRVWNYFLNDLSSVENQSTNETKATLISIGIFILRHLDNMRKDDSLQFDLVLEISETIVEGM